MRDVGAKIHKLKGLKLHAKMILADGERAVVGSINLAPGSFDARRELAIEVDGHHVVDRLNKVARHDWEHSRPIDLSDEGLRADLEKRGGAGARTSSRSTRNPARRKRRSTDAPYRVAGRAGGARGYLAAGAPDGPRA